MASTVTVFLAGPDETSIVSVPSNINYEDFRALVNTTLKHRMRMTFELDGERVKLDNADALRIFLSADVQRHRLICTPMQTSQFAHTHIPAPISIGESSSNANNASMTSNVTTSDVGVEDSDNDRREGDTSEDEDMEDVASPTAPDYHAQPSSFFDVDDVRGKITVYLDAPITGHSERILLVDSAITYSEFEAAVARKLGHRMQLSFKRGDNEVSVDDDDSLHVFLLRQTNERRRMSCVPNGTITGVAVDSIVYPTARPPVAQLVDFVEYQSPNTHGEVTGALIGENEISPGRSRPSSGGRAGRLDDRVYIGHTGAVHCCAFSPDGKKFISASRDKTLRLWSMAGTSKLFDTEGGRCGHVLSCAYSPAGDTIISGNFDGSITIWNAQTGKKIGRLKGHKAKVYSTSFNANGSFLATASVDKTIRIWNFATRTQEAKLKGHTGMVFCCSFSRTDGGQTVVSGSDDETLKVWDWRHNRLIRTLEGHLSAVWACGFSSDDRYIVSGAMDRQIILWDPTNGNVLKRFNGHTAPVHHVMFTRDDRFILSAGREGMVYVWSVESGQAVHTFRAHESAVFHFDYFGDNLLTCSHDATIKLHRLPLANLLR
jgi:WD40 repeat protein